MGGEALSKPRRYGLGVAIVSAQAVPADPYAAHAKAVAALKSSYDSVGAGVRLGKRTSNLFRFPSGPSSARRLDVSAFEHVLSVDPVTRTADVQGMVTYERLVDATLAHGLMPYVVPQLKTITLGGAVAGLGIESSSYRNGLPHESVRELEVLTGDGRVLVATPDNEHAELFRGFPNSYGTLGYTLRLRIDLEPVRPYVRLRHLRFDDAEDCFAVMGQVCGDSAYEGERVDFVDGTVFGSREHYLTLATFVDSVPVASDYTGMAIYYRSLQQRSVDHLTVRDYLWRWDTDWFWCSRAFGVQSPLVRRVWPSRYRRSDVYRRLVALDRRYSATARVRKALGKPAEEYVVQDVEVPIEQAGKFLDFFHRDVGIQPVWLCPLRLRSDEPWPLYPLEPDRLYVNLGFWSGVSLKPGQTDGSYNRLIEQTVNDLGGHKSLYSSVHYPEDEFWDRYNGEAYHALKRSYDPAGRLPDLYHKVCAANGKE
jgi:FAD/FMN-containing dehydrogenase